MLSEKYQKFAEWIIYQIYPRSFMDSNHDGIGDLRGIISKLDYLQELGVNAIWICPCYKSPNVDNGYDIADYRDIMEEFGTMDDMKELIQQAHAHGIRVIMDLVPNHTSSEHKWFIESKKSRDNEYSDYYYWFDEPQNDWPSAFSGSVWEYCEERGQYYLHSYAIEQPDLNWNNPKVREEMKAVVDFWVDLGVDGFRCDVIDQISKDFATTNYFGPHLHEYINELFGREKTANIFTVGECWADNIEEVYRHCGSDRDELSTLFQFEHLELGRNTKYEAVPQSLTGARDILIKWQNLTYERDLLYSLFTDNHDQAQFIARMGDDKNYHYESATCIATMFYTLRGVPFIYQGQEFGTGKPCYDSIEHFDDIETVNLYHKEAPEIGEEKALARSNFGSRDCTRRPMCWSGEAYSGFSTVEPWITTHSEYQNVNLEKDRASEKSVFRFYQALLKLRRNTPAILHGDFTVLSNESDPFFVFERSYEGETYQVICNFEQEAKIALPENAEILLHNYADCDEVFRPYEVMVLKK